MKTNLDKILIIQTAFIGDVILATSLIEKLVIFYPEAKIDFLLRKGNEALLENHPKLNEVLIWNKKKDKYSNLKILSKSIHANNYDLVINLQRFASSGVLTAFSGAKIKVGFKKNPLSFLFTNSFEHKIGNGLHEIERNQKLIEAYTDLAPEKPRLYPTNHDYEFVQEFKNQKYICLAPSSVWFTKQLPQAKWVDIIHKTNDNYVIYLLGSEADISLCDAIIELSKNKKCVNLSGKLTLLQSAALMQHAEMNHVNDSAPLHLASAMDAPVTTYFCSTQPEFGFGPLSTSSKIVQINYDLKCRPCGLHGKKECPEGHFKCGNDIKIA